MPKWLYSSSSRRRRVALGDAPDRVQAAHARVAQPREDELARDARGDHLVVDEVGGHARERQVAPSLADDLVAGREADEVREPLDGHRVAVAHERRRWRRASWRPSARCCSQPRSSHAAGLTYDREARASDPPPRPTSTAVARARVTAVIAGLTVAVIWTIGTLLSARASREVGAPSALGAVMLVGLVASVPLLLISPAGPSDAAPYLPWLLVAGGGNIVGLLPQLHGAHAGATCPSWRPSPRPRVPSRRPSPSSRVSR